MEFAVKEKEKMGRKIKTIITLFLVIAIAGMGLILYAGGNMTELKHEIHINASPEKVWNVLSDLEAVKRYNPTVAEAHYISSNREGIGAARQCALKPKGMVKERIIGWEMNRAIEMELYESEWPVTDMKWRTTIAPYNGGTLVTQILTYMPKGIVGAIMNFIVMKRTIYKTVGDVFKELKKYVEAGQ